MVVRAPSALAEQVRKWREQRLSIAMVPTMGALHAGHLSLLHLAQQKADRVVVSIFINPMQFSAGEDFERYPRREEEDLIMLREHGASLAYLPGADAMYPKGFQTTVYVKELTGILCGASRPGHFDGVATVVTKLLLQALPDIAVFGEKDYQQLLVIRRLVRDLDIPVSVVGAPLIREPDGLAMSSRNRYLSKEERQTAPRLFATLNKAAEGVLSGRIAPEEVTAWGRAQLRQEGFGEVDYFDLRDAETLHCVSELNRSARLLAAVHLGKTRLLDNVAIAP